MIRKEKVTRLLQEKSLVISTYKLYFNKVLFSDYMSTQHKLLCWVQIYLYFRCLNPLCRYKGKCTGGTTVRYKVWLLCSWYCKIYKLNWVCKEGHKYQKGKTGYENDEHLINKDILNSSCSFTVSIFLICYNHWRQDF